MPRKKFFTPEQANAMLPLVRRIVGDISTLAHELRERHQRATKLARRPGQASPAQAEELEQLEQEQHRGQVRMEELETELQELGVLLKDYFAGLIDFPCWKDGREIYLCWKLDELDVGHWHETDAGFSGRRKLMTEAHSH